MSILDKLANAARAIPGAENYADAVKAAAHTPTARLATDEAARWAGVMDVLPAATGLVCNHARTAKEDYLCYGAQADGAVELDIADGKEPQVFLLGYDFPLSHMRDVFAQLQAIMDSPLVAALETYDAARKAA